MTEEWGTRCDRCGEAFNEASERAEIVETCHECGAKNIAIVHVACMVEGDTLA